MFQVYSHLENRNFHLGLLYQSLHFHHGEQVMENVPNI